MSNLQTMVIRVPPELAVAVRTVAEADGVSMSEVGRRALADHVDARRGDEAFRVRLRARLDRTAGLLGETP